MTTSMQHRQEQHRKVTCMQTFFMDKRYNKNSSKKNFAMNKDIQDSIEI